MPGGGATRAKARLHARVHGHRCYCVVRALLSILYIGLDAAATYTVSWHQMLRYVQYYDTVWSY